MCDHQNDNIKCHSEYRRNDLAPALWRACLRRQLLRYLCVAGNITAAGGRYSGVERVVGLESGVTSDCLNEVKDNVGQNTTRLLVGCQ